MKNFPIIDKETEREYWISRSVAVVILVKAKDLLGNKYILATKRGIGTPDPEFIGKWCLPCGYVEFDETIKQAAKRELQEETGLDLPISDFNLVSINDNPREDKRQNITFRYVINSLIPIEDLRKKLTTRNSEENEVSDITFININHINHFNWAFNHDEIIKEI